MITTQREVTIGHPNVAPLTDVGSHRANKVLMDVVRGHLLGASSDSRGMNLRSSQLMGTEEGTGMPVGVFVAGAYLLKHRGEDTRLRDEAARTRTRTTERTCSPRFWILWDIRVEK